MKIIAQRAGNALTITIDYIIYLQSYDTIVLSYNYKNGTYTRHWDDYSVTTGKHIRKFICEHVDDCPEAAAESIKRWYLSLPYDEIVE